MAAAHWTEDLFLRHPEVFLAVHENAWSKGEEQARDLNAILERFGVPAGGRILQEYGKLVRPGGILVIYIVNRDFVVRHFDPQGYEALGDLVHIEQRHLDLVTSRMRNEWRFFRRNGVDLDHILTVPIDHCIYSLHELRRLLVRGGWHPTEAFGGFKMDAPSIDSPTQVVVGRR